MNSFRGSKKKSGKFELDGIWAKDFRILFSFFLFFFSIILYLQDNIPISMEHFEHRFF